MLHASSIKPADALARNAMAAARIMRLSELHSQFGEALEFLNDFVHDGLDTGPIPFPSKDAPPRRRRKNADAAGEPLPLLSLAAVRAAADVSLVVTGDAVCLRLQFNASLDATRRSAALLRILLDAPGMDADGYLAWTPYPQLTARMAATLGSTFSRHRLHTIVNRLRDELQELGLDRAMIETDTRRGVRIAIRPLRRLGT